MKWICQAPEEAAASVIGLVTSSSLPGRQPNAPQATSALKSVKNRFAIGSILPWFQLQPNSGQDQQVCPGFDYTSRTAQAQVGFANYWENGMPALRDLTEAFEHGRHMQAKSHLLRIRNMKRIVVFDFCDTRRFCWIAMIAWF